jgi:hypothetical protein
MTGQRRPPAATPGAKAERTGGGIDTHTVTPPGDQGRDSEDGHDAR